MDRKEPIGRENRGGRELEEQSLRKGGADGGTRDGFFPLNRSYREQDMVMDSDVFLVCQEKGIL